MHSLRCAAIQSELMANKYPLLTRYSTMMYTNSLRNWRISCRSCLHTSAANQEHIIRMRYSSCRWDCTGSHPAIKSSLRCSTRTRNSAETWKICSRSLITLEGKLYSVWLRSSHQSTDTFCTYIAVNIPRPCSASLDIKAGILVTIAEWCSLIWRDYVSHVRITRLLAKTAWTQWRRSITSRYISLILHLKKELFFITYWIILNMLLIEHSIINWTWQNLPFIMLRCLKLLQSRICLIAGSLGRPRLLYAPGHGETGAHSYGGLRLEQTTLYLVAWSWLRGYIC